MPVASEPNVNFVITGSGIGYIAPYGTALPSLTTKPAAADWKAAGFGSFGYTDSGYEFAYQASVKAVTVDEVAGPVRQIIDSEAASIKVSMAEVTLDNLARAHGAATLTNDNNGLRTVAGGGGTLKDWVVAVQEPGVGGSDGRVILLYKANATGSPSVTAKRTDKQMLATTFTGLNDSTQAAGSQMYKVFDFNSGS